MSRIIFLFIGYFIGCLQTSYLIGKYIYKIDIRNYGSGNAGATNTTRTLGKRVGILVFCIDIFKGMLGFTLPIIIFNFFKVSNDSFTIYCMYSGLGVMLGHNFPFYLKFRGGKGVSSFLGILLVFNYKLALLCYTFGFFMLLIFRYISLSSMTMGIVFSTLLIIFNYEPEVIFLGIVMTLLILIRHRANIIRILQKNEPKVNKRG